VSDDLDKIKKEILNNYLKRNINMVLRIESFKLEARKWLDITKGKLIWSMENKIKAENDLLNKDIKKTINDFNTDLNWKLIENEERLKSIESRLKRLEVEN